MDVSRDGFQACLPLILKDIANAHFVSIDLELSGIPGPQINRGRLDGGGSSGKPTLQERYTDIKHAVERYQVLQLGLTCVLEDKENGSYQSQIIGSSKLTYIQGNYLLKPYNFFLNPVPDQKLHVERIFAYQSGGNFLEVKCRGFVLIKSSRGFSAEPQFSHGSSIPRRNSLFLA